MFVPDSKVDICRVCKVHRFVIKYPSGLFVREIQLMLGIDHHFQSLHSMAISLHTEQ